MVLNLSNTEIPGRHHLTFPHFPRSPFDLVNIRILQEWMKTSKQKLARDPDTPWDDSDEDSSSAEESDVELIPDEEDDEP